MLNIRYLLLHIVYILRTLSSLLFSNQRCVACNTESCACLCSRCANELFFEPLEHKMTVPNEYCTCCSRRLISENELCIFCKRELEINATSKNTEIAPQTNKVFLFPYIGKYIDIVLTWKNEDVRELSALFAKLIARYIEETPSLQGLPIVPVPPRPRKIKTKGWDQLEDICSLLEVMYGVKIARLLARKDGHTQKGLSKEKREKNLKEKFYIKKPALKMVQKNIVFKKIILLDDVITTGSTMTACSEVLKRAGCEDVIKLVLFFN